MAASRKLSGKDGEDEYWDRSSASAFAKKGNLFDDSVDLKTARNFLTQTGLDDFNDDDSINWDGSFSGGGSEVRSARYQPNRSNSAAPSGRAHSGPTHTSETVPGANVTSIQDAVNKSSAAASAMSGAKVSMLEQQLDAEKKGRYDKVSPMETVKRIICGQSYILEMYKSKEDKLLLLDSAIKMHDGNAITAAVLFLKNTIKPSIFNLELTKRPAAVNHYISYLRQHHDWQELLDLLSMLGRSEDAAMLKYKQTISSRHVETRVKALQTCYNAHFQSDPFLQHDASLIQEQISLLQRQAPIEVSDAKAAAQGDAKFKATPRISSIVNMPVVTTLYYCCLYHFELTENNLASPVAIRKAHNLTEKEYLWTALNARARLKSWDSLSALFETKGWLGGKKMKAPMGFERVVLVLSKQGAPPEVLNTWCNYIEDAEKRIEVGKKYQCHTAVLDTFKQLKDRVRLKEYYDSLKPQSQEWFYGNHILNTSSKEDKKTSSGAP